MQITPLRAEEAAVRRYVEDLWLPYNRERERTVESFALADAPDAELVAEEVEFRLDRLAEDDFDSWVAVDAGAGDDGDDAPAVDITEPDTELVGFVTAERAPAPSVFDRPDRLVVGDIYVTAPHRGGDVARALVGTVADSAEAVGATELALDVDVDNHRAQAFYDALGFETRRHRRVAPTDEL